MALSLLKLRVGDKRSGAVAGGGGELERCWIGRNGVIFSCVKSSTLRLDCKGAGELPER